MYKTQGRSDGGEEKWNVGTGNSLILQGSAAEPDPESEYTQAVPPKGFD